MLLESHNLYYACARRLMQILIILPVVPIITVQLNDGGSIPAAGQQYSLTGKVSGAEKIYPTITYQWVKNTQTQVGNNSKYLFFSNLTLSDAGVYNCWINIHSLYISEDIMLTNFQSIVIRSELIISQIQVLNYNLFFQSQICCR